MPKDKKRCNLCNGIGLIMREKPFQCRNCINNTKHTTCFLCENANRGFYIECTNCYGSGEVKTL